VARTSAGLLLWRWAPGTRADRTPTVELLLGHMGGPFWAHRDDGAWSIPKGLVEEGEDVRTAAEREFAEELGQPPPAATDHPDLDLGIHRAAGKQLRILARHGDLDPGAATGGTFELEWPPHSGRRQRFPEVDRAAWLPPEEARRALAANQQVFVDRLLAAVADHGAP
jgi:predicted NUDIX family NTP pyrophosphohydrolase